MDALAFYQACLIVCDCPSIIAFCSFDCVSYTLYILLPVSGSSSARMLLIVIPTTCLSVCCSFYFYLFSFMYIYLGFFHSFIKLFDLFVPPVTIRLLIVRMFNLIVFYRPIRLSICCSFNCVFNHSFFNYLVA